MNRAKHYERRKTFVYSYLLKEKGQNVENLKPTFSDCTYLQNVLYLNWIGFRNTEILPLLAHNHSVVIRIRTKTVFFQTYGRFVQPTQRLTDKWGYPWLQLRAVQRVRVNPNPRGAQADVASELYFSTFSFFSMVRLFFSWHTFFLNLQKEKKNLHPLTIFFSCLTLMLFQYVLSAGQIRIRGNSYTLVL